MFTSKNKNIDSLISECQKYGSYYTIQTILGYIDYILVNTRNLGYTVPFIKLKREITSTNIHSISLKILYEDILNIIHKSSMNSPEIVELETFIIKLKEKSIY